MSCMISTHSIVSSAARAAPEGGQAFLPPIRELAECIGVRELSPTGDELGMPVIE